MALFAIPVAAGLFTTVKAGIIASVIFLLSHVALRLVVKVMVGLGMGYVVFQGIDIMLDQAYQSLVNNLSGLPVDILAFVRYMEIDKMINVIFSAYAINAAFKTATLTAVFTRR